MSTASEDANPRASSAWCETHAAQHARAVPVRAPWRSQYTVRVRVRLVQEDARLRLQQRLADLECVRGCAGRTDRCQRARGRGSRTYSVDRSSPPSQRDCTSACIHETDSASGRTHTLVHAHPLAPARRGCWRNDWWQNRRLRRVKIVIGFALINPPTILGIPACTRGDRA